MEPRYSWDEFHNNLRDINFWLKGYSSKEYIQVMQELAAKHVHAYGGVYWCVGVGPMDSLRQAISSIALELLTTSFSTVIKVHLKPATPGWSSLRIEHQLTFAVAEQLGILDQECIRLADRLRMLDPEYIKWERDINSDRFMGEFVVPLDHHLRHTIAPLINKELSSKRYLLSVENLYRPIDLVHFSLKVRLPPPSWNDSVWFISTTSRDVYEKSKSIGDEALSFGEGDCIALLIPKALHLSAKHIFSVIRQEGEEYWHHIALRCFHYAMLLLFAKHPSHSVISEDELIYQWAAEEILPQIDIKEEETGSCTSKCARVLELGRVILETFQEYSLLQLPFSPADDATQTAAHLLAYHGLIAEGITVDELYEGKKWISFMGDHGWHVSPEWLSREESSGPTALILRGCSEQSLMFSKLDHFLPKLHLLHVLDLSYTPLKSLPSSVGSLQSLRLLSLRACSSLETLFSSSSTTSSSTNSSLCSPLSTLSLLEVLDMNGVPFSHLTQEMGNQKRNLIYLDMSNSEVTTFPANFFLDMTNLEKLILNNCSKLVELPNSMTMLSNLMTLEITGTQIRYFPEKIFAEMQKLRLLKLIKNKKLICLPESLSGAHNLIELHIEGWESTMLKEIKLEGYPTLRSFVLIDAPHIRRLSLCTCRMLESVEFKGLSALEELYLSATAIKEVPADIPNLPLLRRFIMMDFPSRLRFHWHRLQRLPDVFCLDHRAEENVNPSDQITQVCISDPWFFYSFNETARDLVRDGRFFQSFYVQISPCTVTKMLQDEERMLDNKLQGLVERQSAYVHVYSRYEAEEVAIASPIKAPLCQTDRHVDIPGMQQDISIHLKYLLQVTRSLSVTCDTSISSLSYLSTFDDLEECDLRWCNKMEIIFGHYEHKPLNNLRNMHVCNLKSLLRFSDGLDDVFSELEHIHIQCCPRLEDVSPCQTALPRLKTLDILFCYNLKSILVSSNPRGGSYQLPSLQRIRLQELPLLQHLDDDNATIIAPMWKELHIRGCWSLRHLPCLQDQSRKVKVNGERGWWRKLRWDSPLHRDSYEPELPPEFASFDESAEVASYLR